MEGLAQGTFRVNVEAVPSRPLHEAWSLGLSEVPDPRLRRIQRCSDLKITPKSQQSYRYTRVRLVHPWGTYVSWEVGLLETPAQDIAC